MNNYIGDWESLDEEQRKNCCEDTEQYAVCPYCGYIYEEKEEPAYFYRHFVEGYEYKCDNCHHIFKIDAYIPHPSITTSKAEAENEH